MVLNRWTEVKMNYKQHLKTEIQVYGAVVRYYHTTASSLADPGLSFGGRSRRRGDGVYEGGVPLPNEVGVW